MRRNEHHEPIIDSTKASCTCGRWSGPIRGPEEHQGPFTHRANDAHRAHVADIQTRQPALPGAVISLFEGVEA